MIKLSRPSCPDKLAKNQIALTDEFISTGKSVWNKSYIRELLAKMSNNKCCYCECRVNEESKYMEVEHFKCKKIYPNDVVNWNNLLPSCKRCNANKLNHDVVVTPIIDPALDDPKNHLGFREYRFEEKTELGKNTLDVLNLNETDRLVYNRFLIGEQLKNELEKCDVSLSGFEQSKSPRMRNMVVNGIKHLLKLSQPESEYAATVTTILLNEELYIQIKNKMSRLDLWDQELQQLENVAVVIKLKKI